MKKKTIDKKELMEHYSDYLLTEGKPPVNVYQFTKKLGISEDHFYRYFTSFESLESEYLVYFFQQSLELVIQTDGYDAMSPKEKLLHFYFVFFENLTLNRSLVLHLLRAPLINKLQQLRPLHHQFNTYIQSVGFKEQGLIANAPGKLKQVSEKTRAELIWAHFLSVLQFWKDDRSPGFEKTDMYIEKSIELGFEIINTAILGKFFDLGKFLWSEKVPAI